jgi:glycosyltransferase involved in cell wall biosynthesis
MFEADRIPAFWADASQQQDLIILPDESSKSAWVAGGVSETKLRICPLGIDPAPFAARRAPLELGASGRKPLANYRVRFLNISALRPRKNLLGLLRTWISATSSDDDAVLILKLGCYQWGFYELFRRDVQELQIGLGKSLAQAAPIYAITQVLPYADVLSLYAAATHYISMSFGEGWDLPMMEAAATGLQLIAPYHSAYPTYLDESVVYWLPSRAVPVVFEGWMGREDAYLFDGLRWWRPDETVAAQLIRDIIDRAIAPKASARDRILTTFTWDHVARRLIDILSQWP